MFAAKNGKKAIPGPSLGERGANFTMGDSSDGRGPTITSWDPSLGPWPTPPDGFSANQIRLLPRVLPSFPTQFDKEQFRRDLAALSEVVAKADTLFLKSQSLRAGIPNSYPDAAGMANMLRQADELQALWRQLWAEIGPNGDLAPFIEQHPNYAQQIAGTLPLDTAEVWRNYQGALNKLENSLRLYQQAIIASDNAGLCPPRVLASTWSTMRSITSPPRSTIPNTATFSLASRPPLPPFL